MSRDSLAQLFRSRVWHFSSTLLDFALTPDTPPQLFRSRNLTFPSSLLDFTSTTPYNSISVSLDESNIVERFTRIFFDSRQPSTIVSLEGSHTFSSIYQTLHRPPSAFHNCYLRFSSTLLEFTSTPDSHTQLFRLRSLAFPSTLLDYTSTPDSLSTSRHFP